MSDPHGPTRVLPPTGAALRQPSPSLPSDHKLQDARRAAGSEYDVLGEICEVGEGKKSGVAYLARRRSATRLDALRLVPAGEYVEVLGAVGMALEDAGDLCPNCGTQLRAGVRFCGNCRANLSALPLTDAPGSMSIAEWMESKDEAARHGYELLGQIDDQRMRSVAGQKSGASLLLARASSTSRIVALLLERPAAGASAVLGLDQTNLLGRVVESLFDGAVAAAPVAPVVPDAPVAPVVHHEPPHPPTLVEPLAPPIVPPPPPKPLEPVPRTEFPWMRVAAMILSGAALIAAIAWLVSAISSRNPTDDVVAVVDTLRVDSVPPESTRADTARPAIVVVDSATLRIAPDLPAGTTITVDGARRTRRTIRLAPGRHALVASAPGYVTERQTIDVQPGEALSWPSRFVARPKQPERAAPPPPPIVASACAEASNRSDWARALDVCARESSAGSGSAFAERTLGTMYERGLGVAPSMLVAAVWYEAGASHGDRESQYRYALLLQNGNGVRRNTVEAAQWYQKAADRGHAEAQTALGMLYANGDGVAKSDADAAKWLKKAAAQGNDRARQELARRNW